MVTRIRQEVLDDLTGQEGAATHSFAIEGQQYEVDLTPANWAEFQELTEKFVAVARKVGGSRPTQTSASKAENAKIREWARRNGHEAPARGRIPESLRAMYVKAN